MAMTNRVRQALAATLQGLPLMHTIETFTAPKIEFDTEDLQGGRFITEEMAVGMQKLTAKLSLQGLGAPIFLALGVSGGDDILLQVREAGVDQDNNEWWTFHTIGGKLKTQEEKETKMKEKPVTDLELMVRTYSRTENGVTVIDIDTRTQKCVINGVDYLKAARRAVGLS